MYKPVVTDWVVYGLNESVKASKYPMAANTTDCDCIAGSRQDKLACSPNGQGHDQFLTGIICQFDLTFSIKAWVEAERYHFLDFVSSQSTMHRITKMDIYEQCNGYVHPQVARIVKLLVDEYNDHPTPEGYLYVLYNVPAGFRLTARMTTNYRQLKTIYAQRKNHRLPEWRLFCDWIKELPHSEWITGGKDDGKGHAGQADQNAV